MFSACPSQNLASHIKTLGFPFRRLPTSPRRKIPPSVWWVHKAYASRQAVSQLDIARALHVSTAAVSRWAKKGAPISEGPEACRKWQKANIFRGKPAHKAVTQSHSQVQIISALPEVVSFMQSIAHMGKRYVDGHTGKPVSVGGRLATLVGRTLNNNTTSMVLKKFTIPVYRSSRPGRSHTYASKFSIEVRESRGRHTTKFCVLDQWGVCLSVWDWHFEAVADMRRLQAQVDFEAETQARLFRHGRPKAQKKDLEQLDDENLEDQPEDEDEIEAEAELVAA